MRRRVGRSDRRDRHDHGNSAASSTKSESLPGQEPHLLQLFAQNTWPTPGHSARSIWSDSTSSRSARTGADSNSAAQRRHHGLQTAWGTGNDHRTAGNEKRYYAIYAPARDWKRRSGAGVSAIAAS